MRKTLAVLALMAALPAAHADFPERPITLIVPFPAGGPTDIVGRVAAAKAGEILGQQIVVENRTGAAGTIGITATARAKPDGYTLGLATVSTHGTAPHLFPNLAYDPIKDFTPVSNLVTSPNILSVNPSYPAADLTAFVAHVRANPGRDGYANAGAGGVNDLGMIWFLQLIGGKMTSIAYRGSAPALTDAVSGVVPVIFDNFPRRCRTSRAATCVRWPSPARRAIRACPRCPPSPNRVTAITTSRPGMAWSRRPACRTRCATSWPRRSPRPCAIRPRPRRWRRPVRSRWATRRPSSPRRSRPSRRAGRP